MATFMILQRCSDFLPHASSDKLWLGLLSNRNHLAVSSSVVRQLKLLLREYRSHSNAIVIHSAYGLFFRPSIYRIKPGRSQSDYFHSFAYKVVHCERAISLLFRMRFIQSCLLAVLSLPLVQSLTYHGADYSSLVLLENAGQTFKDGGTSECFWMQCCSCLIKATNKRKNLTRSCTTMVLIWRVSGYGQARTMKTIVWPMVWRWPNALLLLEWSYWLVGLHSVRTTLLLATD